MESNKKTAIVPKETPHFFIWIPKDGKIQESEKVVPVPEVYIKMLCEEATKLQKTKTPCLLVYMSSMFPEASRSEMKKLETEFRKNGFSNVHIVDYDTDMKNDVIKTQAGQLHNKTLEDFKLIYKNSKNQNSTDHNPAIECIGGFVDFFRLLVLEYSDVMLKNINNKSKDILYRDFDMILKGDNMS
ncbi:MAG: hypothetical protein RL208_255, partial [Pseudomonadota bacterium]